MPRSSGRWAQGEGGRAPRTRPLPSGVHQGCLGGLLRGRAPQMQENGRRALLQDQLARPAAPGKFLNGPKRTSCTDLLAAQRPRARACHPCGPGQPRWTPPGGSPALCVSVNSSAPPDGRTGGLCSGEVCCRPRAWTGDRQARRERALRDTCQAGSSPCTGPPASRPAAPEPAGSAGDLEANAAPWRTPDPRLMEGAEPLGIPAVSMFPGMNASSGSVFPEGSAEVSAGDAGVRTQENRPVVPPCLLARQPPEPHRLRGEAESSPGQDVQASHDAASMARGPPRLVTTKH